MNLKEPEGQLARWLEVVSEYDVTIQHRPGTKHGNADGLSRRPCKQCAHCNADSDSNQVVCEEKSARVATVQPLLSNSSLAEAQTEV